VILTGNSMAPHFQRGDLVLVHAQADYQVGDAVAYRHPTIGQVFHRIIDREAGRYLLQGDNNAWTDSYMPNTNEVTGKLWVKVPYLGSLIAKIREPGLLALFSAGAGIALVTSTAEKGKRPGRSSNKKDAGKVRSPRAALPALPQDVVNTLGILAAAALIFLIYLLLRPTYIAVPASIPYQHRAMFAYSAQVPADLYDRARVEPGEPIFRRITEQFTVTFDYQLAASSPIKGPSGTLRFFAVLSEHNGWKHTLELQPLVEFNGPEVSASAEIDISELQGFMDHLEERTGLSASEYMLSIHPEISLVGQVGGHQLIDTFAPQLDFIINPLQLRLADNQMSGEPSLDFIEEKSLQVQVTEESWLSFLGARINIKVARASAALAFAALAGLTIYGAFRLRSLSRLPDAERIQGLYGQAIVPIEAFNVDPQRKMTEISSIEHLLQLAEQEGRSLLSERRKDGVYNILATDTFTYYYKAPLTPPAV
jgi:signal peptidase I